MFDAECEAYFYDGMESIVKGIIGEFGKVLTPETSECKCGLLGAIGRVEPTKELLQLVLGEKSFEGDLVNSIFSGESTKMWCYLIRLSNSTPSIVRQKART